MKQRAFLLCLLAFIFVGQIYGQSDETATITEIIQLGRGSANAITWNPTGDIISVAGDGIWLYDNQLNDIHHFSGLGNISNLVWSPVAPYIATIDANNQLEVWQLDDEPAFALSSVWKMTINDDYPNLTWSSDGGKIAVIHEGEAHILDAMTGETLRTIPELSDYPAWHPDGVQLAGVLNQGEESDGKLALWDTESGEIVQTYATGLSWHDWYDVFFSGDGSKLVGLFGLMENTYIWDTATSEQIHLKDQYTSQRHIWWEGDKSPLLALSYMSGTGATFPVHTLDKISPRTLEEIDYKYIGDVQSSAKHPSLPQWVFVTSDGILKIWTWEDEVIHSRFLHPEPANLLSWSTDGDYLAVARSIGHTFNIWNFTDPENPIANTATFRQRGWTLSSLRWIGARLIGQQAVYMVNAPGAYPIAMLAHWDAETGQPYSDFQMTNGGISQAGDAYFPSYIWNSDFSRVVTTISGSETVLSNVTTTMTDYIYPDEALLTWDIGNVYTVRWSPDERFIAMVGYRSIPNRSGEYFAEIYDSETGDLVNHIRSEFEVTSLNGIMWSPDSSKFVLTSTFRDELQVTYYLEVFALDTASDEAERIMGHNPLMVNYSWHPESILSIRTEAGIELYDVTSVIHADEPIALIPIEQVAYFTWHPNGEWLTTTQSNGVVRVLDVSQFIP